MSDIQTVRGSRFLRAAAGVQYTVQGHSVHSAARLGPEHEGPPGHVHGGVLASLLDEAMGLSAWATGRKVVAVNIDISYVRPAPLETPLTITAQVVREEGRKVFAEGAVLLPDGSEATRGRGVFVAAPHLFGASGFVFEDDLRGAPR